MTLFESEPTLGNIIRTAEFSDDGQYRYQLTRVWDRKRPTLQVVMLNSSTAGKDREDPTSRKVFRFAARWGFGSYVGSNLFAYVSPDPKALLRVADPIGPLNERYLDLVANSGDRILAAWGAGVPLSWQDYAREVGHRLRSAAVLDCTVLGVTKEGWPRHPLYVRETTQPLTWTSILAAGGRHR